MKSIKKIVTSILAVSLLSVFVSCKTGDDNNNAMLLAATANNSSNTNSDDTLREPHIYIHLGATVI